MLISSYFSAKNRQSRQNFKNLSALSVIFKDLPDKTDRKSEICLFCLFYLFTWSKSKGAAHFSCSETSASFRALFAFGFLCRRNYGIQNVRSEAGLLQRRQSFYGNACR